MFFRKVYSHMSRSIPLKYVLPEIVLKRHLTTNKIKNGIYRKIWNFAKFSASAMIFGSFITMYSIVNYGYYFKDSISWNPNWDSSNKKKKIENTDNAEKRKWHQNVLVRHGQYNLSGKCDEEKKLTDIGREQARETGKYLRGQYGGKVGIIYHSNLLRAKETAEIISNFFPEAILVEDPNLAEGVPIYPSPPLNDFDPKRGEINSDRKRIDNAFRTYFIPESVHFNDKVDIIVCHGNVIRYMFCKGLQYPTSGWLRLNHSNCGITRMSVSSDSLVVCNGFGDSGHLMPEIHTFN
ncbi:phosphoglycerate mutase [Cryptosporidium ryanae]|uniref:phosphoglycerate mutase n=1 Tax=Cryptosporidium ryanae TaxID=515981 RepID=UPI003519E946|nr:phosphoglycerate mutase [Cryptosporidium ryanae]